ncbi:MAG: T9SS type A sorting domain-containing protein [Lewinellaceae bacterium]|nr:T9SS type A sorting domain-containing protein [Saprospiraceae bacterium]MCB9340984.1 T9SS type A sorting domain-containing protein [Lewinellaceae bacterium]
MSLALLLTLAVLQLGWSQQTFKISGTVTTETGVPAHGFLVQSGNPNVPDVTTDANGYYELEIPAGEDAIIAPFRNNDLLNGVSTLDKVLIERHILGIEQLDSPYKLIAADVNHTGTVTSSDVVTLYDAILNVINEFPDNTSWRFVDANYVFPNPSNPFESPFPELFNFNAINSDISGVDFIAVKVGDVNGTAELFLGGAGAIQGSIFFDQDDNCAQSSGDSPLTNWIVVASNAGTTDSFYANSNVYGDYELYLPPGTYDIEVVQASGLFAPCTGTVTGVNVALQSITTVDFAQQAVLDCPAMEVELSTYLLRRCFQNYYHVQYCNNGTATAEDASVEVTLDPYFIDVSSSIPWASVNSDTYTFNVGDVQPGECGNFFITFKVSCDAELGQTHCTSAHVYPDSSCVAPNMLWSGADLIVTGECVNDEVVFTITNTGDDMDEPVEYVVIEDIMIQMTETLQLPAGGTKTETRTANGATWRLETEEAAYHPYETFASATVEGCPDGFVPMSYGFVNLFPMPDEAPFEDIDCRENVSSWDPNDKTGFPLGVGERHFIEPGQPLDYLIRFQNTGTDTAFNILVIDSLQQTLDPASIKILGSSHPMTFVLGDRGVARFIFNDIMLPDSNVNEPLSHGYVKFSIAQKPGLPLPTVIENSAAIYFDFNAPIITNTTWHTVDTDFIEVVSSVSDVPPGFGELLAYPNPSAGDVIFEIPTERPVSAIFQLFDPMGRQVLRENFTENKCRFQRNGLAAGVYFYRVEMEGGGVFSGRVILK